MTPASPEDPLDTTGIQRDDGSGRKIEMRLKKKHYSSEQKKVCSFLRPTGGEITVAVKANTAFPDRNRCFIKKKKKKIIGSEVRLFA